MARPSQHKSHSHDKWMDVEGVTTHGSPQPAPLFPPRRSLLDTCRGKCTKETDQEAGSSGLGEQPPPQPRRVSHTQDHPYRPSCQHPASGSCQQGPPFPARPEAPVRLTWGGVSPKHLSLCTSQSSCGEWGLPIPGGARPAAVPLPTPARASNLEGVVLPLSPPSSVDG